MKKSWQVVRSLMLSLLVTSGVIIAVTGCPLTQPPVPAAPAPDMPAADSGPCPHYFDIYFRSRFPESVVWKLAGLQIDVPEYNDCQRMMLNNYSHATPALTDLKFGNVAAIFARAKLNDVYQAQPPIGSATGRFSVLLRSPHPSTTRLTSIAVVWTKGGYAPLGLSTDREFACVVLQWEPELTSGEKPPYHAWMVPVSEKESCENPLDLPPASAYRLGAQESPAQNSSDGPDEIPPVARWDWDAQAGEQYIGIACPSGWCELYGEGPAKHYAHTGSKSYPLPPGLGISGKDSRVIRQKGWYDEEYLASTTQAPGAPLLIDPTGAFGTIFPDPELKDRTLDGYSPLGTFVRVAWISIDVPSAGYLEKYGIHLNKAPPQQPTVNALYLCLDDGTKKCKVKMRHTCSSTADQPTGHIFYARLGKGPGIGEGLDFCVEYIGTDPTASPPGTVRWRWLDNDQTIWVSCPAGCCQIKPPA